MRFIKYIYVFTLISLIVSCTGQDKNTEKPKTVQKEYVKGTNPKEIVKVNKTYDSKGKLVKFDSIFTYHRSSKGLDSSKVRLDTVYNQFKSFFNDNYSSLTSKKFNEMFLNDSLFKYDFLNKDFFEKRFELNVQNMNEMFRQMDSLKNTFLKKTNNNQPKRKRPKQ